MYDRFAAKYLKVERIIYCANQTTGNRNHSSAPLMLLWAAKLAYLFNQLRSKNETTPENFGIPANDFSYYICIDLETYVIN